MAFDPYGLKRGMLIDNIKKKGFKDLKLIVNVIKCIHQLPGNVI